MAAGPPVSTVLAGGSDGVTAGSVCGGALDGGSVDDGAGAAGGDVGGAATLSVSTEWSAAQPLIASSANDVVIHRPARRTGSA